MKVWGIVAVALLVAACTPGPQPTPSATNLASTTPSLAARTPSPEPPGAKLPPPNAAFDYQMEASTPIAAATVVFRPLSAGPVAQRYNGCLLNVVHAVDAEADSWRHDHPAVVLQRMGREVVVPELPRAILFDIEGGANRMTLYPVLEARMQACAEAGFSAVVLADIDRGLEQSNVVPISALQEYVTTLIRIGRARGLAVGFVTKAHRDELPGWTADFIVTMRCAYTDSCRDYHDRYIGAVFDIETTEPEHLRACASGIQATLIRRGYVNTLCPS